MDFDPPDEFVTLVGLARNFREREVDPPEAAFLDAGHLDFQTRLYLEKKSREAKLWALDVPVELGGQGLGLLGICMVAEEMSKSPTMFQFEGSPEPSLYSCNEEQRERFLFPVIRGEKRSCYAFTEPDTGSDLASMRTKAIRDGDNWIINGSKIFISRAATSDFVILYVSTPNESNIRGYTCFLVETGTPGYEISRVIKTMGDGWDPCELEFKDCVVPDANRLGEVGEGWALGKDQLTHGRIKIAAYQLGIARRSLDIAIAWARTRETWGKPIAARQGVQWLLVDSHVELHAARLMVYRAAALADEGRNVDAEAYMAKLYATEMSQRVTDRCLQVLGGMGYSRETPIQSFYRQARLWRIGHGTTEIMRWMIAREILGPVAKG